MAPCREHGGAGPSGRAGGDGAREQARVCRGRAGTGAPPEARAAVRPPRRRQSGRACGPTAGVAGARGAARRARALPEREPGRRRVRPGRRGGPGPRPPRRTRGGRLARPLSGAARRPMKTSELDYELPPELIAQRPLARRDRSRLLVYERSTGAVQHRRFDDLPDELTAGALTVVNDTRVLPARLRLRRPGGGETEVLLLERVGANGVWEGLARPSRRLRRGQKLRPGGVPRAPRRGALGVAAGGRAGRGGPTAPVNHRAARRSRS